MASVAGRSIRELPARKIYVASLIGSSSLISRALRERLRSDPTVLGDIEHHVIRPFVLFLEETSCGGFRATLPVFRAGLLQPAAGFLPLFAPKNRVVGARKTTPPPAPVPRFLPPLKEPTPFEMHG